MLPEASEDLPVTGEVRVHDEDVVEVYHDVARQDEILKDVVHHSLEGGGGVCKTEEHDCWFKQSSVGDEGCFPFVPLFNAHVVVTPSDVKFGEEGGSLYSVDHFRNQW